MYALIIVIHIVACFILIASILLQSGRGGGLADLFGGGTTQTIFGTRASAFLTRTTTTAAIVFLLTCISLTVFSSRRLKSLMTGAGETKTVEQPLAESSDQLIPEEDKSQELPEEKPLAGEAEPQTPQ